MGLQPSVKCTSTVNELKFSSTVPHSQPIVRIDLTA